MKLKHVLALTIVCLAQAVGAYQPLFAEPYANAIDAIEKNDFPLALKILNPLAGKGDEKAQTLLGQMYMNGWGVPQNFKKATEWYRLSAAKGYPLAQSYLADAYRAGRGITQDNLRAYMWYNILAATELRDGIREETARIRDWIAKDLTTAQIEQAQSMAEKCFASKFKDCD